MANPKDTKTQTFMESAEEHLEKVLASGETDNVKLIAVLQYREKLEAALTELEKVATKFYGTLRHGTVLMISAVPYEVTHNSDGTSELKCMFSKRQLAAAKGLPIPEKQIRGPRKKKELP